MRIGVVTYDYDPPIGGMGSVARLYVEGLRTQFPDHHIVVISPAERADDRVSRFARLRWRRSGGCPLFSLVLQWKLTSLIRKHELDILHVHAGSGGVFLLRKPCIPLLITAHHTYRQEADLVFRGRPIKRFLKMFMALLERRTYLLADRITCVSRDTAEALERDCRIPVEKIVVVENPLVCQAPMDTAIVRNRNVVLSVGRLEERKGTMTLLQAFAHVHRAFPRVRLRLIGANLMGASLHGLIAELKIESSVDLIGHVPREGILVEWRQAGLVVVSSILEGFGLAAAEAMVHGCPVVVSDAPGLKSLAEDGRTGLVFRSGDAADLAHCLERLLKDPPFAQRLGAKAAEEIRKRCSVADRVRDLEHVMRSLRKVV